MLSAPDMKFAEGAYGGGVGGVARNTNILLNCFRDDEFSIYHVPTSVRKGARQGSSVKIRRFLSDVWSFCIGLVGADGVHIFGQYRTAIYREFAFSLICRLFGKPSLYQIRAGYFIQWAENGRWTDKLMARKILTWSAVVLCEGRPYVNYVWENYGKVSRYFPNFVPIEELPDKVSLKLSGKSLKLLFVGFCSSEKGVTDLIEACKLAAEAGTEIELTLVGKEEGKFREWLDEFLSKGKSIKVNRIGRVSHECVLRQYGLHDVFCMPSRYHGEGHNNSINEAMMMGMVIICSRNGFLPSVLSEESAYFLDMVNPKNICSAIREIDKDRLGAQVRANNARSRLLENFTSARIFPELKNHYIDLVSKKFKGT